MHVSFTQLHFIKILKFFSLKKNIVSELDNTGFVLSAQNDKDIFFFYYPNGLSVYIATIIAYLLITLPQKFQPQGRLC